MKIVQTFLGIVVVLTSSTAVAGLIKVHCDPGTIVSVITHDANGSNVAPRVDKTDNNNDGVVEFGFSASQQERIKSLTIVKTSDGQVITYDVNFVGGGVSEFSENPFEIPQFGAFNPQGPLYTQIDYIAFKNENRTFTTGELLPVAGGLLAGSPSLFFSSGSPGPPFSGLVQVGLFDEFLPPVVTPEPSGILLFAVGIGLLFLLGRRWHHNSQNRRPLFSR